MGMIEQYLLQLNALKRRFRRSVALLTALSLVVVLTVFWNLRQTGITIANSASCGLEEHQHTQECLPEKVLTCGYDIDVPAEESTDASTEETTVPPAEESTEASTAEPTTEETTEMATEPSVEETTTAPTEPSVEETTQAATVPPAEETTQPSEEALSARLTENFSKQTQAEQATEAHVHTDACYEIVYQCGLEEHLHDFTCFSDETADLEDWDIWAASVPELTGNISEDVVLVAQSQLGNQESTLNFELSDDGVTRNGITRYGQWYGNPYGAWSNMFTSFCLRYAGLTNVPINSGAEKMQQDWEKLQLYRYTGGYEPVSGDIVFLDKNQNGTPESTAVVERYFDFVLTVIEGDVDNAVVRQEYRIDDPVIVGYGMTNPAGRLLLATAVSDSAKKIGQTVDYTNTLIKNGSSFILYTMDENGSYYALDGNGDAVALQIDNATGDIYADVEDPKLIYWIFGEAGKDGTASTYPIRNVATEKYLYPHSGNGNTNSMLRTEASKTALHVSGGSVKLRGENQQYAQLSEDTFVITASQDDGTVFSFGKAPATVTLWLDGTNGNIMSYRGSDNTKNTVYSGVESQLPSQWKSPTKYNYKLAGWVNIKNGDYYLPGDKIVVTENTVLYADWVAATYDIGVYNSFVADTVSTNDFITTHVFDYSSLINLLSTKVSVNVSDSSHSETWSHVGSGTVSYKNQPTLNFSFNDHDGSGSITNLNNLNAANKYTGGTAVYSNIYNSDLGEALFGIDNLFDPETGEGVVGKHYLGQGDHLFQINTDPTSEYYGYYYYDAKRNAASYNQTDQRFYVYDYLARSSDSANNNDAGKYSDFLPLNSPYANTNGQTIKTYNYSGDDGEYDGISHYVYDARYNSDGSAANQVKANLWFGMRVDVRFGLPDAPGERLSSGEYGNKDIYGNDMHFKFTGDDDVWILVDGAVALDLGGIHQAAEGDINFSSGEIRVNGRSAGTLSGIEPGEHTLSILYLERGSSMSNCAIYFNLAPRFSLTLQKEDVLTQEVLNGAQFGIYNDQACTDPCDLWPSQQSYQNGEEPTNIFTIENGKAYIWGLSPSRSYYIREEKSPDAEGYEPAKGVIRLVLDKNGLNSDSATILEGIDENGNPVPVSHGFTVHGFRIDEENQAAYITITNAQDWVEDSTSIYVEKRWEDTEDHTYDSVTVYLNVTDDDGTVRRIREIALSEENDWKYAWSNLPKYALDPETMTQSDVPVKYSVSEAYVPGYTNRISVLENGTYQDVDWASSNQLINGKSYLLMIDGKYLSTVSESQNTLCLVDEAVAKASPLAIWKATVGNTGLVSLNNQKNQYLSFYSSGSTRYITVSKSITSNVNLTPTSRTNGVLLGFKSGKNTYNITGFNSKKNYLDVSSSSSKALTIQLLERKETTTTIDVDGTAYAITNIPLTEETSLKVTKRWDHPTVDESVHEKEQVTIKLLANGVDTGRTETVSLKNNWTVVFNGLPYLDDEGNPIVYTVEESWETDDWTPVYGLVTSTGGNIPTYETTITNVYSWTGSFELPSTGGIGYSIYILGGLMLTLAPLVYGLSMRRRYRKGAGK